MPSASRSGDPATRPPTARGAPPTPMARGSSKNREARAASASFCFVSGDRRLARVARTVIDGSSGNRFYVGFPKNRARVGEAVRRRNRLAQRARPNPADARGHDFLPRAFADGSGRSRNVARLTFDDEVGGAGLARRGPSRLFRYGMQGLLMIWRKSLKRLLVAPRPPKTG